MQFLWIVTVLSCCISGFVMIGTLVGARSAPQEAAAYAMACAFAVVPYVFSRALQALVEPLAKDETTRIVKAIEAQGRPPVTGTIVAPTGSFDTIGTNVIPVSKGDATA